MLRNINTIIKHCNKFQKYQMISQFPSHKRFQPITYHAAFFSSVPLIVVLETTYLTRTVLQNINLALIRNS